MDHGGNRIGAGRKPGVPNKMTQQRLRQYADLGLPDPVQCLLEGMVYWRDVAGKEMRKRKDRDDSLVRLAWDKVREFATPAAPYIRPRLSMVKQLDDFASRDEPTLIRILVDGKVDKNIIDGEIVPDDDPRVAALRAPKATNDRRGPC